MRENVHAAELDAGTSPQLKGPLPVQPDTLVKVGALTPDPSNITDNGPIWRFALNDAVDVGVKLIQMFSAIDGVEPVVASLPSLTLTRWWGHRVPVPSTTVILRFFMSPARPRQSWLTTFCLRS